MQNVVCCEHTRCRCVRWACVDVVCCGKNCTWVWIVCTVSLKTQSHWALQITAAVESQLHTGRSYSFDSVRRCMMRGIQALV